MQDVGYVLIDDVKYLVLRRFSFAKKCVLLKVRKSGKDGIFLKDESDFVMQEKKLIKKLLGGEVVPC